MSVAAEMQPVLQKEGGAVAKQRVSLHLAHPDASPCFAALHWLVGEVVNRSHAAALELVRDHVPQALIVHHPNEDVHLELEPACAADHGLPTQTAESVLSERITKRLHGARVISRHGAPKGRGIHKAAIQAGRLGG